MNDNESYIFTVDMTDEEPARRSGSFGETPKLPLGAKLLALWSGLFGLVVGVLFVLLMSLVGDDLGAGAVVICALIFAGAHTAASAVSFKRYKRKYDVLHGNSYFFALCRCSLWDPWHLLRLRLSVAGTRCFSCYLLCATAGIPSCTELCCPSCSG